MRVQNIARFCGPLVLHLMGNCPLRGAVMTRPLNLAEITFLAGRIEAVPDNKRELARSLIGQAMRCGTLAK